MPEHVSDFEAVPWAKAMLEDPACIKIHLNNRRPPPPMDKLAHNTFLSETCNNEKAIRAWQVMFYPAIPGTQEGRETGRDGDGKGKPKEWLCLLSVGSGMDGWHGVMHGGVTGFLMDNLMGIMGGEEFRRVGLGLKEGDASPRYDSGEQSPEQAKVVGTVTKELVVRFKRAVRTPGVLLVRARVVGWEGEGRRRGLRLRAWVEDGNGTVFAVGESVVVAVPSRVGKAKL